MANITKADREYKRTLVIDDYEFEIIRQALRAYRHKLIAELADLVEDDRTESNPDIHDTREWIDRTAALKADLGDR